MPPLSNERGPITKRQGLKRLGRLCKEKSVKGEKVEGKLQSPGVDSPNYAFFLS
jgi:hypothetical protein